MALSNLLNKILCDKIVQSASLTIGHGVLITDDHGYVISSSNPKRVGTFHEASIEVIESKQNAYHNRITAKKLTGTEPGMTIPITIDSNAIGTIGITGLPHEISQYALLIQQLAEIFLNFQKQQATATKNLHRKRTFILDFITYTSRSQNRTLLYQDAYSLGINLDAPAVVVILDALDSSNNPLSNKVCPQQYNLSEVLARFFPSHQDFIYPQGDNEFLILTFIHNNAEQQTIDPIVEKCKKLQAEVLEDNIHLRIGIGSISNSLESLRLSYENACTAIKVIKTGIRNETCLSIYDTALEYLASGMSNEICSEVKSILFSNILKSKNYEEIILTIEQWYCQKFNFVKTAQALHIHKSTLVYRFRRIQETCGLDLYDFNKVLAMYLLIIQQKLNKESL